MIQAQIIGKASATGVTIPWEFPWPPKVGDALHLTIRGSSKLFEILEITHCYTDMDQMGQRQSYLNIYVTSLEA